MVGEDTRFGLWYIEALQKVVSGAKNVMSRQGYIIEAVSLPKEAANRGGSAILDVLHVGSALG